LPCCNVFSLMSRVDFFHCVPKNSHILGQHQRRLHIIRRDF
jgi:hypothetical protein